MRTGPLRGSGARVVFALIGAVLVLTVLGPIARLLLSAPASTLRDVIADQELHNALILTLLASGASTAVAVGLGTPLGYLLARVDFPLRRSIAALLNLPVVIPHPVAGIALVLFLGRNSAIGGPLAQLGLDIVNHVPGLVVAMLFVSAPLFVSSARQAFQSVDPTLERVARSLGDSEWLAFRRITLPLARRGLLAGALLSWARAVSEFGAVVVVTYNPKVASVLIFDRFTTDGLRGVIPASAVLLVIALVVVVTLSRLEPADRT